MTIWRRALASPLAPLVLLAAFAVLIVVTIDRFSIWIDESATLDLVGPNGYAEIVRRASHDVHPPLWYLVLKPWLQLFGTGVVAARSQAAVFMLAAFGVWYHFFRTRWSRRVALLALALMVTNPMLLHYAVEGRMYAWGCLLTALGCVLLTGTWRWRWLAYWVCAVVMLYTHYFLAFVVAGQFAYLLLRRGAHGRSARWLVVYGASMILAFGPWLPFALHGTSDIVAHGFWIPAISASTFPGYVLTTFLHRLDGDLKGWFAFLAVTYLVTWIAVLVRVARERDGELALLWALIAVPAALLLLLSCRPLVPVFHPRYLVFSLPALIALLSLGALACTPRRRGFAIAVLLAGNLAGLRMLEWRGFNDTHGYWSMKTVAAELAQPIDGEVPTVVATALFVYSDAHILLGDHQPIVYFRDALPKPEIFPDILYYDHRDWWILSFDEIHARHVWLLENVHAAPFPVPATWHLEDTRSLGYARYRLFTLPRDGAHEPPKVEPPAPNPAG